MAWPFNKTWLPAFSGMLIPQTRYDPSHAQFACGASWRADGRVTRCLPSKHENRAGRGPPAARSRSCVCGLIHVLLAALSQPNTAKMTT
eukprot:scaffold24529_cov140-Isochrysis_galbana.AAC.3